MKRVENNGVTYLTFDKLNCYKGLKHGFSTRLGGVSTGVYGSMNLGLNRGDDPDNVHENYRRISAAIGLDYKRLCPSQQTHTVNLMIVREEDAGNGLHKPLPYRDVDGLITNVKNLPLVTFYADCVPLFIYDPVCEVIALAHSGWRGTVGNIGGIAIDRMREAFGTDPADVIACIGPSICGNCYEVSGDVASKFIDRYGHQSEQQNPGQQYSEHQCSEHQCSEHQASGQQGSEQPGSHKPAHGLPLLRPSIFNPDDRDKYMLNLWEACRQNFKKAGVPDSNIEVTDYCTRCNPDLFYSHRVMGAERGSLAAFMSL